MHQVVLEVGDAVMDNSGFFLENMIQLYYVNVRVVSLAGGEECRLQTTLSGRFEWRLTVHNCFILSKSSHNQVSFSSLLLYRGWKVQYLTLTHCFELYVRTVTEFNLFQFRSFFPTVSCEE